MKTPISSALLVLHTSICLLAIRPALAASQTIQVSGEIHEQFIQVIVTANGVTATAFDTWTGNLAGDGVTHIFSSDVIDFNNGIEENVISSRTLFTSDGNLFLSEVGSRNGDFVSVVSTVVGGTGIFKNATGQLLLSGIHINGVQFTYTGSITLAQ